MGEQGLRAYIKRFFHDHPFISSTMILVYIVYRFFPCTFAWIISASPVFICTSLLLGTLLYYGEPNIHDIEVHEKQSHEILTGNNVEKNETSGALSIPRPPTSSKTFVIKRGYSVRRLGRNSSMVDANCDNTSKADDRKEVDGVSIDPYKNGSKDNSSDSDTESDQSENSITEASAADVMPELDELHPLLDPEPLHLENKSADNSYAPSGASSQNRQSDDSGGEETENQEEEEDEEEEAQEEKDDGSDGVVKWTADDQKNLMDLGTSELERNQRLENLIAKRRARKIQRVDTEKNLIDFDCNDPAPIVEELSRLLVNVPPISVSRRNPFDLPDEPDIPGSAPTKLSMRNPFDLQFDQDLMSNCDDNIIGESSRLQEPAQAVQQRDIVFRRHESFTVGPSFFSHCNTTTRPSRFNLSAEKTKQEAEFDPFERQSNERSDSKMSSAEASETSFVDEDLAANKEHSENNEAGFGSPAYNNPQHVGAEDVGEESHYSDEDGSGDEQEQSRQNMAGDDHKMDMNTSDEIEENHHIDDGSDGEEEDDRNVEVGLESEVIDVKYDNQASSTSSENDERNDDIQIKNASSKGSLDSVQSVIAESEIQARATEKVVDSSVVDPIYPIYDSSPSALDKTLSNSSALDEALFHGHKESFNPATFSTSDMQIEMSEVDTPRPTDKSFLSGDEGSVSSNGSVRKGMGSSSIGAWVATSNLSSVEDNESRTKEVTEVRELDVIQVGFSAFPEDFSTPMAHSMPYSPAVRFGHHPSFASVRTESSEYSSMDEDVSSPSEGDGDVVSDNTVKFMPDKQQQDIAESPGNGRAA